MARGYRGLFRKTGDAPIVVDTHDAKGTRFRRRNVNARHCHVGGFFHMIGQQLAIVHFINVIPTQDQHVLGS